MLPIGDNNRLRSSIPLITYVLIALNILFFFAELDGGDAFIVKWSFVPSRFLAHPANQSLTIFTSMFMHAGWVHLGGNMLYLWIFGDNVEDRFGAGRFFVFYLLCGIAATFAQLAFGVGVGSNIPNLGASGAIAGVLGAYILMFPQARIDVLMGFFIVPMPALIVIGLWFMLQLVSGLDSISNATNMGGVAYMAHLGGFLAGFLLTHFFRANRHAWQRG